MTSQSNDAHGLEVVEQVLRLTMRAVEGSVTDEERSALEKLLAESVLARRTYWRCIVDELGLRAGAADTGAKRQSPGAISVLRGTGQGWLGFLSSLGSGWKFAALVTFVLVGGTFVWRAARFQAAPHHSAALPAEPVATLVSATNVRWELGHGPPQIGAALPPGKLSFRSGVAEIEFRSGVRLVIEGPASLDLIGPLEAKLLWGRLVMAVPKRATGFQVDTPLASVVDLGTSSGISVTRSGQMEVHVFEGSVELQTETAAKEQRVKPVKSGQAELVDWRGDTLVVLSIPVRPEEFVHDVSPPVVIDPLGVWSKMVDDFNDGQVTVTDGTCQPNGSGQTASETPQPYVETDFSLVEDRGVLRGKLVPMAIDPHFHLRLRSPIEVQAFPYYRLRVWTASDQSMATYYYGPNTRPSVTRLSYDPPNTAVARTWRELQHAFRADGLLPDRFVSAFRIDFDTFVDGDDQRPFMIDYIVVDKYQTTGLAEFDHAEDSEGWTCIGIEDSVVGDGVLRGRTLTKGALISNVRLSIRPEKWTAIEVRMKLAADAGGARFGWGRAGENLEVERSVGLPNIGDGQFHTYVIGLEPYHGWSQLVTKFAIWFGDKGGKPFEVDYIRALAVANVGSWIQRLSDDINPANLAANR